MIATNHLVIASTSELRARDENCITNAELHSKVYSSEFTTVLY
jgi:hypothetical protein